MTRLRRVLVTGGAGFVGANLVRMLLDRGYHVTVLDNLSTGQREYLEGLPIQLVEGDILDVELVNRTVSDHEGIVHLAAQTGVPTSLADPKRDCEVNVVGTLNLLEACRQAMGKETRGQGDEGTRGQGDRLSVSFSPPLPLSPAPLLPRFVFASSNAALGRQPPPATEDKAPLPISPYGASKLAGEGYCLAYYGSWGLGTVVLRFANVYGPYSAHKDSVVARFFKDILTSGQITIDGDGRQTRDFIYIGDLCRAILLALESDGGGEVFQIATGTETSILELAGIVREVIDTPVEVRHGPARLGDIRENYSAVGKAHAALGWEPQVALHRGLRLTGAWFRQPPHQPPPEGGERGGQ